MGAGEAAERLWDEFRGVYAAAASPTLGSLVALGEQQRPPARVADATLSEWLTGRSVPAPKSTRVFLILVAVLQARAKIQSGYQPRPDGWWQQLLMRAQDEQMAARKTGRPRRSAGPPLTSRGQEERLLNGELETANPYMPYRRWASVVPHPPMALVERRGLLAGLRQALLAGNGVPVLVTGMGGAGKSVLAAQLARAVRDGDDAELAAAYPAGAAWVTVGRERPLSAAQLELATAFGEARPDLGGDWQSGRLRLQQLASGQRGLVVLDDVWTQDRYEPFRVDTPGVQILITTRNQALATDLGGLRVMVGQLEPVQSHQLLASSAGIQLPELPGEASEILSEVGHLALGRR